MLTTSFFLIIIILPISDVDSISLNVGFLLLLYCELFEDQVHVHLFQASFVFLFFPASVFKSTLLNT